MGLHSRPNEKPGFCSRAEGPKVTVQCSIQMNFYQDMLQMLHYFNSLANIDKLIQSIWHCLAPMFKKTLDARQTLAYGLEFRKFKRRLNVIKLFLVMLRAKSIVITQLEVITVTIPLAGSKISSKY
jgi:hypothetical protein